MTPQERQLVDDLFTRLASVENTPRDLAAAAAIAEGLRPRPTRSTRWYKRLLVQDEALKRAHDRIQQLEAGGADNQAVSGEFLDQMRDTLFGSPRRAARSRTFHLPRRRRRQAGLEHRTGVAADRTSRTLRSGPQIKDLTATLWHAAAASRRRRSFLGTAAAAAAGAVGGGLLLSSIRSMMGGGGARASSFGDSGSLGRAPTRRAAPAINQEAIWHATPA